MNLMYFLIVIGVLLIIAEILAIGLRITGLDREKALFQVVSILTGTGFTTNESELITQHSVRRKLAEILMLVSYVGQATIIGLVISIVTRMATFQNAALGVTITVVVVILIIGLFKNPWFVSKIEKVLEKNFLEKSKANKNKTVEEVLKLKNNFGVVEFLIDGDHPLVGVTLEQSNLKKQEIQVLNIERGNYIEQFPRSSYLFKEGDRVVAYGKIENIKKIAIPKKF